MLAIAKLHGCGCEPSPYRCSPLRGSRTHLFYGHLLPANGMVHRYDCADATSACFAIPHVTALWHPFFAVVRWLFKTLSYCPSTYHDTTPTSPRGPASNMLALDQSPAKFLFDYRGADLILRSHDYNHFRVPRIYLINSSTVLEGLIESALRTNSISHDDTSLPIVKLPESGSIIHSLLTFILPVPPLLPLTTESAMELLSVAQKYQMVAVLDHIRGSIAQQNVPSFQQDDAFRVYSLAQKYGLHREALQAAQTILKYPTQMNIENLEDKLDMMSGASLYELWKYYESVRAVLRSDLTEFRMSGAGGTLADLHCTQLSPSQIPIPRWLDDYVASIGDAPNLFDFIEFNTALARHLEAESSNSGCDCECVTMPSQTVRNFWGALASVVDESFKKVCTSNVDKLITRLMVVQADPGLSLVRKQEDSRLQVNLNSITSPPEPLDVIDANLIIQSSDLVNFRVHKAVLAMSSRFFEDLLSLPQPLDSETIDGLPVVRLPEDAELLRNLVSMLYPVHQVPPKTYDKVLYLLAACQKYDMVPVKSSIRAEVDRGSFPAPVGTEAFGAYAIASSKGLIPEMKNAARLTLDSPMTFETIGEDLRLFDGWALRQLARIRKRRRDNVVACLESFINVQTPGPSRIWVGCPDNMPLRPPLNVLPSWLEQVLSQNKDDLKMHLFTHPLTTPSSIRKGYLRAIHSHADCYCCLRVHAIKGSTFCAELENRLAQARDKARGFTLIGTW